MCTCTRCRLQAMKLLVLHRRKAQQLRHLQGRSPPASLHENSHINKGQRHEPSEDLSRKDSGLIRLPATLTTPPKPKPKHTFHLPPKLLKPLHRIKNVLATSVCTTAEARLERERSSYSILEYLPSQRTQILSRFDDTQHTRHLHLSELRNTIFTPPDKHDSAWHKQNTWSKDELEAIGQGVLARAGLKVDQMKGTSREAYYARDTWLLNHRFNWVGDVAGMMFDLPEPKAHKKVPVEAKARVHEVQSKRTGTVLSSIAQE